MRDCTLTVFILMNLLLSRTNVFSTEEDLIYISIQDPVVCSFVSFSPHHFCACSIASYNYRMRATVTDVTHLNALDRFSLHPSNPLQEQCYCARYINLHKICLSSLFFFPPISLYVSIFSMYKTHSKDFFF